MPFASLRRIAEIVLVGAVALPICEGTALAQVLPNRPILIVSPYAGGGSTDFSLRTIGRKVEEISKLTIVIESRPGGAGTIAALAIKSGPPDGSRLLLADVGTFASNVTLFPNLAYDPVKDFKPVTTLWVIQNVLAVATDLPVNSLKELVELARKRQGGLSYASPAVGASGHLLGSMLAKKTGAPMINIPFRGALAAASEVVAGRVDFCFCSYSTIRGFVEGKKLKILTLAAPQRDPIIPDVPTTAEAGSLAWKWMSGLV
jgi:tripartite-type tricarboxylate transporter receptor subunit TctC